MRLLLLSPAATAAASASARDDGLCIVEALDMERQDRFLSFSSSSMSLEQICRKAISREVIPNDCRIVSGES